MRNALNALYKAATVLAAFCLVTIALLVTLQVMGRLLDGARSLAGLDPWGLLIPSLAEIAGFFLVGASFLALAGTLRQGDHIRVSILLQTVSPAIGRVLNIWCLAVAFGLASFFSWHAVALVLDSYRFNEVSFGIIPVPLMYPQAVMTLGLIVLAIALLDDLVTALRGKAPSFETVVRDDPIEGSE
ncbi:TRAP transporter small permease [Roseibium denhamense]|uniref:TRAP transporter small permease protein n=1 Tax=Roseibium denhamense TaxID=76305 RepID=A0ABY1NB88_9HYPH|nr:TRAP transporter small permease [Roseibium denhamense]MTI06591.1 TRAP transporter small permease [Roseibium denhamense]SMP05500.1 TRAP-type C4-dicarboxylate transport system, small permease component [Roseibium denhamense]